MIEVLKTTGDHFHICDGCEMESSPGECEATNANECEDMLCAECTVRALRGEYD